MIRSIVQYEVYVLEEGRWSLHARYPGAERDDAITDARRTEVSTGFPTKVVRDTYYPEENRSEEIDAYVSPNVKKSLARKREKRTAATSRMQETARSAAPAQSPSQAAHLKFDGPKFFVRFLLALVFSMAIAAGLTILMSLFLSAITKLGIRVSNEATAQVALYWFLAMFALSTLAINRLYVPWRTLFVRVNTKAASKPAAKVDRAPDVKMTFRPKRMDSTREAELERAREEIKILRGDIPSPDDNELFTRDWNVDSSSPLDAPSTPAVQEPTAAEPVPQGPAPAQPSSELDPTDASESERTTDAGSDDPGQDAAAAFAEMDVERLTMIRFLGDTLLAYRSGQDQLDASSRFGLGVYLAGAASALADLRGLKPSEEEELLAEALGLIGFSTVMTASFLGQLETTKETRKNLDLFRTGQTAMTANVRDSGKDPNTVSEVLSRWKQQGQIQQPEMGDVFLLTYITGPQTDFAEPGSETMAHHNDLVREILGQHAGEEVRHTGKGIFAKFEHPDDAITAAVHMQRQSSGEKSAPRIPLNMCVAVVGTAPGDDDPSVSGGAFSQSDTLCHRLTPGQIACDTVVQEATTTDDIRFGTKIPNAHSGIAEKVNAVEVLWDPLPA